MDLLDVAKGKRPEELKRLSGCWFIMGAPFLIISIIGFFILSVVPITEWLWAQRWQSVECEIVNSELGLKQSGGSRGRGGGTSYVVDITYMYKVGGKTHINSRYSFGDNRSNLQEMQEEILKHYPPGSIRTCYYNASSPNESVLTLEFQWGYLKGFLCLIFMAISVPLVFNRHFILIPWMSWDALAKKIYGIASTQANSEFDVEMPLKVRRKKNNEIIQIFVSVCWFFLTAICVNWVLNTSGLDFRKLIAAFTVVVLCFILLSLLKTLSSILYPMHRITLMPGVPCLGSDCTVRWKYQWGSRFCKGVSMRILGYEEMAHTVNKTRKIERSIFFEKVILSAAQVDEFQSGSAPITISLKGVPSFEALFSKIIWVVRVEYVTFLGTTLSYDYMVIVRPIQDKPQ